MAAFQLLLPLLVTCVAASARPPRRLPACQVVSKKKKCLSQFPCILTSPAKEAVTHAFICFCFMSERE